MTDDASNTLTRGRMSLEIRDKRTLAEISANLIVAAQAEVAHRTRRAEVQEVADRQIDGAELRIRMLRNRPFFILLRMAGATGGRRGVTTFTK